MASLNLAQKSKGTLRISELLESCGEFSSSIRLLHPIKAIATIGGLLTHPGLQANCLRLEAMAHLAVCEARGKQKPNGKLITKFFHSLENSLGVLEDPIEDLFVSRVSSERGDYRIFGGIAEGAAFQLQRFLDIVEMMPSGTIYDELRDEIHSLLLLSDVVADRADLPANIVGAAMPQSRMPLSILNALSSLRKTVTFTTQELSKLGIRRNHLRGFCFQPDDRSALESEAIGHSQLESKPIILTESGVVLALPTAVNVAVRRRIIERCHQLGIQEGLFKSYLGCYERTLHNMPILGIPRRAPVRFRAVGPCWFAQFMTEIDAGRWLHFIAIADDFVGYDKNGLAGVNADPETAGACIKAEIDKAIGSLQGKPEFRNGITLVVVCGWGRTFATSQQPVRPNWNWELISAHDLATLSYLNGFNPCELWRVIHDEEELTRFDLRLQNPNGLLNLIAWERQLSGHLIPHAKLLEVGSTDKRPTILQIEQNGLLKLRAEVAIAHDCRRLGDNKGRRLRVSRFGQGHFQEDRRKAIYVAEDEILDGKLMGAVATPGRVWWVSVDGNSPREMLFQYWEMLLHWMHESSSVLDLELSSLLAGPIHWSVCFNELTPAIETQPGPIDWSRASSLLQTRIFPEDGSVFLDVDPRFQESFHHPENRAERLLVEVLVEATARLVGAKLSAERLAELVGRIVPNVEARHIHAFEQREFRDFFRDKIPSKYISIAQQDAARLSLSLGWRARPREALDSIVGKPECTTFLNATVALLEEELCRNLARYPCEALVKRVVLNYESANQDSLTWTRSSAALLALCRDKSDALEVISDRSAERNAVLQTSRIIIEAATCECPTEGGEAVGDIDVSRLMAIVSCIVHLGGWSDAIRWDALEPHLKISPFGEILKSAHFEDAILEPFGRASSARFVRDAVSRYPKHYEEINAISKVEASFDQAFVVAFQAELGVSLDDCRGIIDAFENEAISRGEPILFASRAEMLGYAYDGRVTRGAIEKFANAFSMQPRLSWRVPPKGYKPRDREPWRYRRRLSTLRLPILQLDSSENPKILVAPGMLRESFNYLLGGYYFGNFDKAFVSSDEMRKWIGAAANRRGHKFNEKVAARMRELGWEAQADVRVAHLLRKGLPRDYGDVDVVAWNRSSGRVLIMECKDLQFRKTHGEIAEQISDFRGELDEDGRPDLLKKHLDRLDIVTAHLMEVVQFCKLSKEPVVEGHVVFRNPVPMQFAWKRLAHLIRLSIFDALESL